MEVFALLGTNTLLPPTYGGGSTFFKQSLETKYPPYFKIILGQNQSITMLVLPGLKQFKQTDDVERY